jgi:hypothetical protein
MSKPLTILGALVIGAVMIFAVAAYWTETDERETTLQREKEIGDAIKDVDANDAPSWRDILLGRE